MHYYPKNIGDYRRDTMNLSLLEHGVYTTLIDHYTLNEKPLPLDQLDICWSIGARSDDEKTAVCLILSKFFIKTDEGYTHKRCDEEIAQYRLRVDTARENGKKGGRPLTQTKPRNNPTLTQPLTNQEPRTNNQEPRTNNHKPIKSKPLSDSRTGVDDGFDLFWNSYPKKVGKGKAEEAWQKHQPNLETVLKTLSWQKGSKQWFKENGTYIPNPTTYINQKRWLDEPTEEVIF